jgi:predicted N-acyltransferase
MLQLLPNAAIRSDLVGQVENTIRAIPRNDWNACFPNLAEDYDCLLSIEEAGIAGFEWRYITVIDNGIVLAAMPMFLCDYALDTTLEDGAVRRAVRRIRRRFPGFLTLRLACLGSPCTENGVVGFRSGILPDQRESIFSLLLHTFEKTAAEEKCQLMGLKDIAQPTASELVRPLSAYAGIGGLPTAWMDVDFPSIDAYLARLSAGTRKDMKRKLKTLSRVKIETRSDFGDLMPQVIALYQDTRNRSEWQFEELTSAYFAGTMSNMAGRALCNFYFVDEALMAVNLLIHDRDTLIDKFFCMNENGRAYNLYFLSWFNNLQYCVDNDIGRYQSGQAYYENKVRLGSQLTGNTMYFRHRNRFVQTLLRWISPYFSFDETKP